MAKSKKLEVEKPALFRGNSLNCPSDQAALEKWPTLCDVMYPRYREDAITWQAGSISIRIEGGYYAVTLTCPTEGKQLSIVVASLATAFDDLEAMLKSGQSHWRLTYEAKKELDRRTVK